MKTVKQLKEMTKADLIKDLQAAEFNVKEARRIRHEECDGHLRDIMNLQARCMTLQHIHERDNEKVNALTNLVNGYKVLAPNEPAFDIRSPDVMNRVSALFDSGQHLLVCPKCAAITKREGGQPGHRICPKCMTETEWPWEGEIKWRVNEDGKFEGTSRRPIRPGVSPFALAQAPIMNYR